MTDPTLSPGVLARLGRGLADVFAGALEHADLPQDPATPSFDAQARAWLTEFEARHAAPPAARPTAEDPA